MKALFLLRKSTLALVLLFAIGVVPSAMAKDFPSVAGIWKGTYKVAFPANHPMYPDQSIETALELEIYKQEDNLIWIIKRWRRDESQPWVVEYATGSFDLDDRSDLYIAEEKDPTNEPFVNTGIFMGEYEDGYLYLNYLGPGGGVSFSVKLSRER